jgi:YtxH-like protein
LQLDRNPHRGSVQRSKHVYNRGLRPGYPTATGGLASEFFLFRHFGVKKVVIMQSGNYEASDRSGLGTAITFLLIGLGAGAAVALLLAPKPGRQLRKDLRRGYDEAVDRIQDLTGEARERIEEVLERGGDIAEALREKAAPLGRGFRR